MKAKTEQDKQTPSCANVAPLLTALFDGEADAQTAQSARAHLLSCERCARAWLDWNQHRTILSNENVPAPPPTLLWRVLLACRLASFARGRKASRPVETAPRHASLFPDAELPTDLSARILAQTTRREMPVSIASRATKPSRWRLVSWPTLAMPALAAWVILLAQGSQWSAVEVPPVVESEAVANSSDIGVEESYSARPVTPTHPAQTARSESGHSDVHRTVHSDKVSPSTEAVVSRPTNTLRVQKAAVERDMRSETEERHVAVRHIESHAVTPRIVESRVQQVRFETHRAHLIQAKTEERVESREEHPASVTRRDTAVPPVTLASLPARPRSVVTFSGAMTSPVPPEKARTAVTQTEASRSTVERPRVRVAALSDEVRAPRPRVARPLLAHFSQDARASLRSSRPATLPAEPTRFASYESPDAAEEHVDEMRSVVDDFRSAFYNDESADTLDSNAG